MKQICVDAVSAAVGRPLNASEIKNIEDRIQQSMVNIARRNVEKWRSLSLAERMDLAAKEAASQLVGDAMKKKQRIARTILAYDRNAQVLTDAKVQGKTAFNGLAKQLENADVYIKGVGREYFSALRDTIQAVEPRFFGFMHDAGQMRDFAFEVFGKDSGNQIAKAGAKAWLDTIELMRARFNGAGGDIGKLDYGYLPQPHDALKVRELTADDWAVKVMPLLDRSRYLNVDGTAMSDIEIFALLKAAHETISTEGLNKMNPGARTGNGMTANRHSDSRQIHFKDAESYLSYMGEFGHGNMFTAMQAHVASLAKDIGMVETFGPNPEQMYRTLHDLALKDHGQEQMQGPFLVTTDDMWASLTGKTNQPVHQRFADIAQGIRNVEVFGKLQGAFISSVTDIPTYFITTGFNRLPLLQSVTNLVRGLSQKSDMKEFASRAGLISDSIISDMNRWAEGNIGDGWTSTLANATMRMSLLQAWTDSIRRAFSVTMMGGLGKISRLDWKKLDKADRSHMAAKGVTEQNWQVWQKAQLESWKGSAMLTPEAIRKIPDSELEALGNPERLRNEAVSRLLGVITDEAEYASLGQDLMTRAAITRGTQKGTVQGEIARSVMLFKGFPMSMISRHWRRAFEQPGAASKTKYAVTLATSMTMFGALALQLKDMINGKDPRDMTTGKFWGAAFAQGGGVGILGDILYTGMGGQNRAGVPNWMNLLGPVVGTAFEGTDLVFGNIGEAMKGEETHVGAEAFRYARSHTPFINLWYAKAALDHMALQDLQEMLSPGYMSRVKRRAEGDWGQGFWWEPGEPLPERAPDFGNAVGE